MKTQIGLGVLSIPAVLDTLGMVPGIIVLLVIAIITTWSDYMVGVFKLRHRSVYGIDDVGQLLFGRIGREFFGIVFVLCEFSIPQRLLYCCTDHCTVWIFVAGAGMLGISIGLNAVSHHGACTAIFVAVAAIIGFMLSSIQTLGRVAWLAWVGVICILSASECAVESSSKLSLIPVQFSLSQWLSASRIVRLPHRRMGLSCLTTRSLPAPRSLKQCRLALLSSLLMQAHQPFSLSSPRCAIQGSTQRH